MKLTVIGFWGAYPGLNEATSAYLIESGKSKVLLDCGSGTVSRLQKHINLADLDAVVLSHYHHDHIADIGVMQYSRVVDMNLEHTNQPLYIYGHGEDQQSFQSLGKDPFAKRIQYDPNQMLTIGNLSFTFHKTIHPAPCYAMKITDENGKSIVYTGDTSYDETLIPFINEADLLIAETSFYKGQSANSYGHMNSVEAATLAHEGNVKSFIISHLPHFGQHEQLVKEARTVYDGDIHLASSDLKWEVGTQG
ncbi:MBL fold metallo-hydrolase [Bacillus shivajii]|uniref:MBL fold metallo-hydrolase n=1 Tax=Bacillus shivajii TaxID=1983719 RepID=UPI001CF960D6|nr:MBL fold metallo-hydrolase [Bacillus shivajii]UCZ52078.1 MBL fold metallo-hydrolase [Bacillus shivajii]